MNSAHSYDRQRSAGSVRTHSARSTSSSARETEQIHRLQQPLARLATDRPVSPSRELKASTIAAIESVRRHMEIVTDQNNSHSGHLRKGR